ncbi:cell wall-binding repeat-containing protein [Georgenia yuyongxinii]|uniref:cell wall-binding repeat-containing protein n=1 Tax=Georgenia yuyongxinii TaxID=2589797 RepID=UPI00363D48DE
MRRWGKTLTAAAVLTAALAGAPAHGVSAEDVSAHTIEVAPGTQDLVRDKLAELGIEPSYEFTTTTDGFTAQLTEEQAAALADLPAVTSAERARPVSILGTQYDPTWGLDRIDQAARTLDGRYTYPDTAGRGVRVYVLDTGVTPLPELGGRLAPGADFTDDGRRTTTDCQGHGTHVAGTIASQTYGVAKRATIVPVRVLGCDGRGETTDVHEAIDWILATHPAGTPGVLNLSIGGTDPDLGLEQAIRRAVRDAGLTVVVAAGNENTAAARTSPARVDEAVTVGASTRADTRWTENAGRGSNWGAKVDLFAPGAEVHSLHYAAPGRTAAMTGTSAAAPHVAGAAALLLGDVPGATPAQVAATLTGQAGRVLTGTGPGSPDLLLRVPQPAKPLDGLDRLGGANRYATAALIATDAFEPGVPVAYVATGQGYADALAAASAAAHDHGPTLLVSPRAVPAEVRAELTRLRPGRIVVLGGPSVVSGAVRTELAGYTYGEVTRVAGADRYETSARVSAATFDPGVPVAYLATGGGYADALAGAPAAGGRGPVLLTGRDRLPPSVAAELERLRPRRVVVLGGPSVVSEAVLDRVGGHTGGEVRRLFGGDRYETAARVSAATFDGGVPVAYVATGQDYADALAGAPAAGGRGPVLLTAPTGVPPSLAAELARLRPGRIVVLGGTGVVPGPVAQTLAELVAR